MIVLNNFLVNRGESVNSNRHTDMEREDIEEFKIIVG